MVCILIHNIYKFYASVMKKSYDEKSFFFNVLKK